MGLQRVQGVMSEIALQRVGPLRHIPALLAEMGLPASRIARLVGDIRDRLASSDSYLPFVDAADLLERCAEATGCPHFGLLIGERGDHRDLGLPGALMASAATVGQALVDFAACQLRNSSAAVVYLAQADNNTFLGYGIYGRDVTGALHVYDVAAAVGVNALKRLGGPSARPAEVLLSHRGVSDRRAYFRILGPQTRFDQPQTALVLPPAVMELPVASRDDARHAEILLEVSRLIERYYPEFRTRVQHMIRPSLLMGTESSREIARTLGVHVRTLNRRLKEEGTSFRELSQQVRFSVACELLQITDLQITDIAAALSYATPAAFVHAFQRWCGMAPSEWRAQRRSEAWLAETG